jgi:hypothetical protein
MELFPDPDMPHTKIIVRAPGTVLATFDRSYAKLLAGANQIHFAIARVLTTVCD